MPFYLWIKWVCVNGVAHTNRFWISSMTSNGCQCFSSFGVHEPEPSVSTLHISTWWGDCMSRLFLHRPKIYWGTFKAAVKINYWRQSTAQHTSKAETHKVSNKQGLMGYFCLESTVWVLEHCVKVSTSVWTETSQDPKHLTDYGSIVFYVLTRLL